MEAAAAVPARPSLRGLLPRLTPRRLLALLRARILLRGCQLGRRIYANGPVLVENEGTIVLGDRTFFVGGIVPAELRTGPGGRIEIGQDTGIGYGVSVEAHGAVTIGRRSMLASFVRVCDLGRDGVRPVTIGDDVWLAHAVIVEPGVTIGDGSVVAAGSVVTRDVPPHHLASGNPARSIRLDVASPPARAAAAPTAEPSGAGAHAAG